MSKLRSTRGILAVMIASKFRAIALNGSCDGLVLFVLRSGSTRYAPEASIISILTELTRLFRSLEIQSIVPDTILFDKLQWVRVRFAFTRIEYFWSGFSLRQRILNTKLALLNVECMLDLDSPMPYDADDVDYDFSLRESIDYSISFDIHSEGKRQL